jgi:hypothetical protein
VNGGKIGTAVVSLNGGAGVSVVFSGTGGSLAAVTLKATLRQGTNTLQLSRASSQSLVVDRIALQ